LADLFKRNRSCLRYIRRKTASKALRPAIHYGRNCAVLHIRSTYNMII